MFAPPPPGYEPIVKGTGVTPAERYLGKLCANTFLSLWSYPTVFRDQGDGKEICDLLVVCENDIIVFSDKHSKFGTEKSPAVEWGRWFKRAVRKGAEQAWGAERWLREFPSRVFLDKECKRPFPVPLPSPSAARFHLIVVGHGVSRACRDALGGSGSLMLRTDICGFKAHSEPFVIGDLDPSQSFVHVFDDTSLEVVLRSRDTITDFVGYLQAKEALFRSRELAIAGEEDLLAIYLTTMVDHWHHGFDFPAGAVAIPEGHWSRFIASQEHALKVQHDEVSYSWDRLIDHFGKHALTATQYVTSPGGFSSSELLLRFMAREPRLRRRMLAEALLELVRRTPSDQRALRVVLPVRPGDPYYVFLMFPLQEKLSHDENRALRGWFITNAIKVTKLRFPDALDIVGIATESGLDNGGRSEDSVYFDAREWTDEDEAEAKAIQEKEQILVKPQMFHSRVDEYPAVDVSGRLRAPIPKNPRNKPCPCGSGEKYKRCHGQ